MKLQLQLSNNKNVTFQLLRRNKNYDTQYLYLYSYHGRYLLFNPRTADDLDSKTFEEPVSSVLSYTMYLMSALAVMNFPAILHATQSPISGVLALVVGVVAAWCGAGLLPVAVLCCVVVFIAELFL